MKVTCYGIIPCRKKGETWEVFLIHQKKGHWGFPKGHPDAGESPTESAQRELAEETGLRVVQWIITEPFKEYYNFAEEGISYEKTVQYYLALVEGTPTLQQAEVAGGGWHSFPMAYNRITFKNTRHLLEKVAEELHIPLG